MPALTTEPSDQSVLRAIVDSAADIASVRDRTVVLKAILRRTRKLIGSDMSYLSLNDLAAGETFIHVTDGVETEAYRTIRMPLGTGVLGAVAAGGTAVQTGDYLNDPEMNHLTNIDEIVRGEGVKSIAGAPLRIGGRVVGALLVANRVQTQFCEGSVRALEQMAAQTAIALEQSRLSQSLNTLTAELRATESAIERRLRELEDIVQLDERLMGSMLQMTGLADVIGLLAEALGTPVGLHEPGGRLIAGDEVLDGALLEGWELHAAIDASARSGRVVGARVGDVSVAVVAASAGDEHLATLILRGPIDSNRGVMLERASVFVSAIQLFERTLIDADNRAQRVLFDDLVSPVADRRALEADAREYGIDVAGENTVMVIAVEPAMRYRAMAAAREALGATTAVVALHGTQVCLVLAGGSGDELAGKITTTLSNAQIPALLGMSVGRGGLHGLPGAHSEAHTVVAAQSALGRTEGFSDAIGLGLAGMLLSGSDEPTVIALLERTLGPLTRYDAAHGTELLLTALTFFESGARLDVTAAALFVHRNTVRQRAERIDVLLGSDWRTPPRSVDLHFALRIWRLRESQGLGRLSG